MKKIIIFNEGIETLDYFSAEIAKSLEKMGHAIFVFSLNHEEESMARLILFYERHKTTLLTFNYHGISGESIFYDKDGKNFWDEMEIPCFNIVVDHPLYYHRFHEFLPKQYQEINIDRYHMKYMEKYFPKIKSGMFLPLAGTQINNSNFKDITERKINIIFTGNYTPPKKFEKYIKRINDEYTEFYYGIINELLECPQTTIEDVAERHLKVEIPDITQEEVISIFPNLNFIDLYVRFMQRGDVIRELVDSGLQVDVCGEGWDQLECSHPENLRIHGSQNSQGCLEYISESKISLNMMPWFRDGAHDRIFNSMANGAICITDRSIYLEEILQGNTDIIFYEMKEVKKLPQQIQELLHDKNRMRMISQNGKALAEEHHLWKNRSRLLHEIIEENS